MCLPACSPGKQWSRHRCQIYEPVVCGRRKGLLTAFFLLHPHRQVCWRKPGSSPRRLWNPRSRHLPAGWLSLLCLGLPSLHLSPNTRFTEVRVSANVVWPRRLTCAQGRVQAPRDQPPGLPCRVHHHPPASPCRTSPEDWARIVNQIFPVPPTSVSLCQLLPLPGTVPFPTSHIKPWLATQLQSVPSPLWAFLVSGPAHLQADWNLSSSSALKLFRHSTHFTDWSYILTCLSLLLDCEHFEDRCYIWFIK